MKNLKLRKIVAAALTVAAISTVSSVGASAAWKQNSTGWWNTEGNSYSIGLRLIDGKWYYFDSNGYMKTGWIQDWGTWYFADPSGALKIGWINYNGNWYYTNPSAAMQIGWVNDSGTWYYTDYNGAMKTGWVNDNGTWYFTDASGVMQTGVIEIDGKIYYFASNGAMQTGQVTINGVVYTFAATGEAIGDNIPTADKAFSGSGVKVTPSNNKENDDDDSKDNSSHHSSSNSNSYVIKQASGYNKVTKLTATTFSVKANSDGTFKFTIKNVDSNASLFITNVDGNDVDITGNNTDGYVVNTNYAGNKTITIKEVVRKYNQNTGLNYDVVKKYTLTINK